MALALAAPSSAGDRALIDLIGYSADGRYFAFEEYGIQDGSGFAYSSIYVIDLPADKWLAGSPYRIQAEDEGTGLAEVRGAALDKAEAQLRTRAIDVPVDVLVLLGDGVPGADGKQMTWSNPVWGPPGGTGDDISFTLVLETFPADSPQDCVGYLGEQGKGFALELDGAEVYRDPATIPKSRGCPLEYRLYAVVQPFGSFAPRVAIVSSYPFGFEGPDRRFLAIPLDE